MKSYGEKITDEIIVAKILRSLTPKFEHVVAAIEKSHDLSNCSFDELMSSLQAHEERLNRSHDKNEEKAFQVKVESFQKGKAENFSEKKQGRGDNYGGFCGRGRGRCRGKGQLGEYRQNKSSIWCHYCNKFGHKEADSNFAEKADEDSKLFMAHDSGCSNHMTGTRSLFKELDESQNSEVRLGDNKQIQVTGKGTISITSHGKVKLLASVLFVPSLTHNLLSIGQLMISGYCIVFDDGSCVIKDKKSGQIIATVKMASNKMFPLEVSTVEDSALIAKGCSEAKLWHLRYGHLNINGLKLLSQKEMVFGLPRIDNLDFCEGCVYGKQNRKSFPIGKSWRASNCLELLHADLCGPMSIESFGGSQYFLLITDDFSRMSWVFFLKFKSEAFDNFKKFKAVVEKQSKCFIQTLRTDIGGEFLSTEFNVFCEENGIHRELTAPHTLEQNGVAERKNRTVVEMARSMLKAKNLPNNFWEEAVATAVYILNISPTKAVLNQTPYEAWKGRKPRVSHLKVFGCIAYALIKSQSQKLDKKSEKCIFIGYSLQSKAYRLYNHVSGKMIISRDVVFNEDASWAWNEDKRQQIQVPKDYDDPQMGSTLTNFDSSSDSSNETTPKKTKSLREIYETYTFALFTSDPICFEEAVKKSE
ncbi:hypothetical protein Patl1_12136 [Pistacia atlantica]|uniref:Uncharacterized protein n=1 Tax=Pistacia atlantica TaxID=434234 RepID=A0ACC1A081_9ROSI|nr:hypothetical protein Patl1_12136 [Pistacia atlantica]